MAKVINESLNNENLLESNKHHLSYEEQHMENARQALEQYKRGELKMYAAEEFFKKLDDMLIG